MKTRLALFFLALGVLPWLGAQLGAFPGDEPLTPLQPPGVASLLLLAGLTLLANLFVRQRSGHAPLQQRPGYLLALVAAGAALGWALYWMQLQLDAELALRATFSDLLLGTLTFALILPAILSLRAALANLPGLLKLLARGPTLPASGGESGTLSLLPLALAGLLAGPAWPELLAPLYIAAPLLWLLALQGLWHEPTVLSGLRHGDWIRSGCAALAGIPVSALILPLPALSLPALAAGLVLGLLSLQLCDVLAEAWHGRSRADVFKRKPFPIPVTTRK